MIAACSVLHLNHTLRGDYRDTYPLTNATINQKHLHGLFTICARDTEPDRLTNYGITTKNHLEICCIKLFERMILLILYLEEVCRNVQSSTRLL